MPFKDLTGQKFGMLTVLYRVQNKVMPSGKQMVMWYCKCDCGKFKTVSTDYLHNSKCPSCGCKASQSRSESNRIDNTGEKYGRLTIVKILWDESPIRAICKCDCGNDYIGIKGDITSGHTQSCGCLQSERTSAANTKNWTGYVADSGVKFIKQYQMNSKGQWLWECVCPVCGNIFYELPAKVNNGHTTSCGCRVQSFGETYIKDVLTDMGVCFIQQHQIDGCKHIYSLRFDFAIFDKEKLLGLVEYDGRQHFEPIDFFGGEEGFRKTQMRDRIKNKFCMTRNIPLLRLPYTLSLYEIKEKLYKYYETLTTAGCA